MVGVAQILVASNSVWKYFDLGADLGASWRAADFDDGAWTNGPRNWDTGWG